MHVKLNFIMTININTISDHLAHWLILSSKANKENYGAITANETFPDSKSISY